MDKENLIELTNKLYKLTLLFPKKEPLRYKVRDVADEILANLVAREVFHSPNPGETMVVDNSKQKDLIFEIKKDLAVLKSYFEVVKWQNWVSYFDVLEIEEKYDKIECKVDRGPASVAGPKIAKINEGQSFDRILDSRKEKILRILKEKEKIQVGELKELLPDVSKRTLRRDFDQLLKQGLVERIGERNNTFYCLKTV